MALSPLDLALMTTRQLSSNPVRSGLTSLGIFIGVAAVSLSLNISTLTESFIEQQLAAQDNPVIIPRIWPSDESSFLKAPKVNTEDIAVLERNIPGILSTSTVRRVYGLSSVQFQEQQVPWVNASGVSENYPKTTGRKLLQGRWFQAGDFEQYWPVAIVDEALSNKLFNGKNPLGQGIYTGGTRLTVVGVSETKAELFNEDPAGELWVTQNFGAALSGDFSLDNVQIAIRDFEQYEAVRSQVIAILSQRYPNFEIDAYGGGELEFLKMIKTVLRVVSIVISSLGLLILVIGGAGIANITIASVIERTREIGLRRAVGATDTEVVLQFVTEIALLSAGAGMVAVISVHLFTKTVVTVLPAVLPIEIPYEFNVRDASLAMGAAISVGVGASLLPALRATRIDVVQALRGE